MLTSTNLDDIKLALIILRDRNHDPLEVSNYQLDIATDYSQTNIDYIRYREATDTFEEFMNKGYKAVKYKDFEYSWRFESWKKE